MSERELLVFLLQFALLLGAARLLGGVARRLGQPSVMGEVVAGLVLGPTVLGHLAPGLEAAIFPPSRSQQGLLELLSWIGMILLMLRTGIGVDLSTLRALKRPALLASVLGIAVPFGVGVAVGLVVPAGLVGKGGRTLFAAFLATAMSISSVKVIAKILLDLNLTRRDVGVVTLGASILDDTVGWILLAIVVRVASTGGFSLGSVAITVGATLGFGALAMFVLRPVAGRAIQWLEREGRVEHGTTTAVLVLALGCATLTQAIGIHAVFGAFVAGLIVAESPRVREATLVSIDSMVMGVFAPVFFAFSGLEVHALALPGWKVSALVLGGAIAGKVAGAGAGARLGGMRTREAVAVGIGLSARGSTELVIARIGTELGVLGAPMYALVVLVPIVTSLVTPVLLRLSLRRLPAGRGEARRLEDAAEEARAVIKRRGAKILVPTSGDPHATQALRLAAPVARLPGATAVGISVVTPEARRRGLGDRSRTEGQVAAEASAVARELGLPDFHALAVRAPSVDQAVVEEAARGYDVVFLGVNRPRALSHALLRALLASGESDVVLVRASGPPKRFRRIVLPVTGAAQSRGAIELAFLYARAEGARVHALSVVDPTRSPDSHARAEQRLLGGRMLEELVERGRREGVDVRCRLLSSRFPARAILDAVDSERADLVLLGAAPRHVGRRAWFGPTTDFVLARAPCAVAIYVGGVRREALRAASGPEARAPAEDGSAAGEGAPLH